VPEQVQKSGPDRGYQKLSQVLLKIELYTLTLLKVTQKFPLLQVIAACFVR